jgi:hypothetical protein
MAVFFYFMPVDSSALSFIQAIQVVGVIPKVHDWVLTQRGVSFAFTMFSYCSSVIVVSEISASD